MMSDLEKANRRIAALERTLARHVSWRSDAIEAAKALMDGYSSRHDAAASWWDAQINQPQVVLSKP